MINDFLQEIYLMYEDNEYVKIIEMVSEFFKRNPEYKDCDCYTFENELEKEIYARYIGDLSEIKVLDDGNLDKIFLAYALAYYNLNEYDLAEKYLKIANTINPVASVTLCHLCRLYSRRNDLVNLEKYAEDFFNYNFSEEDLFYTYSSVSKLYASDNHELDSHLFNFRLNRESNEFLNEGLEKSLRYINHAGIQIGYNPEIIDLAKKLSTKDDSEGSKLYEALFFSLSNFNSFYKGISIDIDLDEVIEDARISIANNKIDDAISNIKSFLDENPLDDSVNYKIFNNEIERDFYFKSSDFDAHFVLLPKNKNYYQLYYLYGYCFKKKEDYDNAIMYYMKSLELSPYNVSIHSSLVNLKLENHLPVKIQELTSFARICYKKDDLIGVYRNFEKYLENNRKWEEQELISVFASHLLVNAYENINLNATRLLEEYDFPIGFDPVVKDVLEGVIKLYREKDLKYLETYESYLDEIITVNDNLSHFTDLEANPHETKRIGEFSEEEIEGKYILIHDKMDERYARNITTLKMDYDEGEFDESDSFICYCYRRITGPLAFLLLGISKNTEDLIIYPRLYFDSDTIIGKNQIMHENATILDDLKQFTHYIDTSDDYGKWIRRNVSGDVEIDKIFLLNELKNIDDDPFEIKKDAIGEELKKIINPSELLKKEVPCNDCIKKAQGLIEDGENKHALVEIDEFLKAYPPLYFDGYMTKYVYLSDLEMELYFMYEKSSQRVINLPESQDYCEIFNLKAQALVNLGKVDEALDYTLYSLKFNPFNVKAKMIQSDIFIQKQYYTYSKQLLKDALIFNDSLDVHIDIYRKLAEICTILGEQDLAGDLSRLAELLLQDDFEKGDILDIRENIVDDDILLGFNRDIVESDLNDKLYCAAPIENILQETKPLVRDWMGIASEKLSLFIAHHPSHGGYDIPYKKFDMSLMYGEESDGDNYYNFENMIDMEIFKQYNPCGIEKHVVSGEFKVCELLNTYAITLKYLQPGKANVVLMESLKLNPANPRTCLEYADVNNRLGNMEIAKEYLDKAFQYCYDRKTLKQAYLLLASYYHNMGLHETGKALEEFNESFETLSFKNDDYISLFKRHEIPMGFNEKTIEAVKNIDVQSYDEMKRINEILRHASIG